MLPLLSYRSPAVGFCSQEGGLGMVRDCIVVAEGMWWGLQHGDSL